MALDSQSKWGCHHYCPLCCNMSCIILLTRSFLHPPLTYQTLVGCVESPCYCYLPHICLKPGCWCLGANYARLNSPWRQRLTCTSRWALVLQGKGNMASQEGRGKEGYRALGDALADWHRVGNSRATHSPCSHHHCRCEITLCTCLTHSLGTGPPSLRTFYRPSFLCSACYLANKCCI